MRGFVSPLGGFAVSLMAHNAGVQRALVAGGPSL